MISEKSDLYRQLLHYQKEGTIGTIIHSEVQDEGDTSAGVGGTTRMEAYGNAFGLDVSVVFKEIQQTIISEYRS